MNLENIFGNDATVLPANPTIEDIVPYVVEKFEQKWKQGYKYEAATVQRYTGGPQPFSTIIGCVETYCSQAAGVFHSQNVLPVPKQLKDEVMDWEDAGGFCIYLSVLACCLLDRLGTYKPGDIKLIQGFYKHDLRADWPDFIPWGPVQTGIHAFLTLGDAVFDFTIKVQEGEFFDFGTDDQLPFLCGPVPDGFELWGWPEDFKTVKEYARQIARKGGLNYYDWINGHCKAALEMAQTVLEMSVKKKQ